MSQVLPPTAPIPGGTGPLTNEDSGPPSALRTLAREADQRARDILSDDALRRLLSTSADRREVERPRQIFVNRNLRMGRIELVGFDMDYTLAVYHMRRIEQLSFDMTLAKLISEYGYPAEIGLLHYDHQFGTRGLVVDKLNGNVIKMDRFGHVGRAYHGRSPLSQEVWTRLYRNELIRLRNPQYAWIDTLFALPEASIYAGVIELLEARGHTLDYARLYEDIREAIDVVHRDNSLKREIRKDIGHYIFKDPELGPTLHKLRSSGKKLFILTNSMWDYTQAVMKYLLDGVLPEYPSWRNYFDFVVTGASKPNFFTQAKPFLVIDPSTEEGRVLGEAQTLERWKVYQGGNLVAFERMAGFAGDTVLYVGDHIYGDILKSKKSSLWRTCMVVQEIEDEIAFTDSRKEEIDQLSNVELLRARIEDEVSHLKA
ncbi:MAG TPA: HAD-IG family 5'-nucleotidase, partial [Myxococcaceae bacterium]|nr:HAD-IG family 5'-nucleotidase [Myxococcaceae bacterium]